MHLFRIAEVTMLKESNSINAVPCHNAGTDCLWWKYQK